MPSAVRAKIAASASIVLRTKAQFAHREEVAGEIQTRVDRVEANPSEATHLAIGGLRAFPCEPRCRGTLGAQIGLAMSPTLTLSGCRSMTDNSAPCDEIEAVGYFSRSWSRNPR